MTDLLADSGRRAEAREFLTETLDELLEYRPYRRCRRIDRARGGTSPLHRMAAYLDGDEATAISESAAAAHLDIGSISVAAAFNLGLTHLVLGDAELSAPTYADALSPSEQLDEATAATVVEDALNDLTEAEGRCPREAFQSVRALF